MSNKVSDITIYTYLLICGMNLLVSSLRIDDEKNLKKLKKSI